MQATLGCLPITDFGLSQDVAVCLRFACLLIWRSRFRKFFLVQVEFQEVTEDKERFLSHHYIRRVSALAEFLFQRQSGFRVAIEATVLAKCIKSKWVSKRLREHLRCWNSFRLWENSEHVARQLDRIGNQHQQIIISKLVTFFLGVALSSNMVKAGLTSFEKILERKPRDIEMVVSTISSINWITYVLFRLWIAIPRLDGR